MPRLRRVSPDTPGWARRRRGKGFVYLDEHGQPLGAEDRARCKALVIPPAWEDVWICPAPNGHIQAVGTDAAGRRQYLYHPVWREQRDKAKHDRVLDVAARLPKARDDRRRAPRPARHAPGAGARHGVPPARPRLLPRRRRGLRRGQRQLRPGHDPEAARPRDGRRGRLRVPGQVGPGAPRGRRRRCRPATPCRRCVGVAAAAPSCSPTATAAAGATSRPTTSTSTSRTSSAARCRPRTSARGTAPCSPPWPSPARPTWRRRRRGAGGRSAGRWSRSPTYLGNTPTVARGSYVDPRVVDLYERGVTIAPTLRRLGGDDPLEHRDAIERAVLKLLR